MAEQQDQANIPAPLLGESSVCDAAATSGVTLSYDAICDSTFSMARKEPRLIL